MSEKKPEDYLCVQSAATLKLEAELSHTATLETITTLLAHIAKLEAQLAEVGELQRYHMMIVQHPYPRDICVTTESDGDWIMYNELTAILAKYKV